MIKQLDYYIEPVLIELSVRYILIINFKMVQQIKFTISGTNTIEIY
jgi:hypothetical protein